MKVDANFKADLAGLKFHHHEETGTRTATISVQVRVEEKKAKEILGEEFHRLAFGSAHVATAEDGENYYEFGYESLKPKFVCESHVLAICGHSNIPVQPHFKQIKPAGKGQNAVVATIELPVLVEKAKFAGELAMKFGDVIDVKLAASQLDMFNGNGVSTGAIVKKNTGNWGNPEPVRA